MSSPYAGNAANWPLNITQPSDGDFRGASSVNVPDAALADRTAYLRAQTDGYHARFDRARLLNWGTLSRADLVNVSVARYFPGRLFLAAAAGATLYATGDFGASVTGNIISAVTAGELVSDIAFDGNGSVVATTNSRYIFDVAFNNLSAAKRDVTGAAGTPYSTVAYLAAYGYWVVLTETLAGVATAHKSTDRTSWSNGGLVNPFSGYANNGIRMGVNPAGAVLAILCGTTTNFRAAVSSNGCSSWITHVQVAGASLVPSDAQVSWDAKNALWVVVLSSLSGADVWTSPDGVTWTRRAALNNRIGRIAVDEDGVYVASVMGSSAANTGLVASFDGGINWVSLGIKTAGTTNAYAHAVNTLGGVAVVASDGNATRVHASLQTGNPTFQQVI